MMCLFHDFAYLRLWISLIYMFKEDFRKRDFLHVDNQRLLVNFCPLYGYCLQNLWNFTTKSNVIEGRKHFKIYEYIFRNCPRVRCKGKKC